MSYTKLYTVVQDHAVGIAQVNGANANGEAIKDFYGVRHGLGIGQFNPTGTVITGDIVGKHNDVLISRTVADFDVDTTLVVPALVPLVSGWILGASLFSQRMAEGQWRIFLMTPGLFQAVALLKSTASVDRKATTYNVFDPQRGPGVIVTTWEQDAGTWAKTDLPFSLVFWAQR